MVCKGIPNPLTSEDLLKILRTWSHLIPLQNLLPISVHRIIKPHKTIFISPKKWIISQIYHINIKSLIVRLWYIPQWIKSISLADWNPLKLLLCSNTSNSKWIIVKLISHLWQVAFIIPKRRSCHDHFWQNLLSNSSARDLVITLMIISDNSLGNNLFLTESPQSSFCLVNNCLWHIISYGIHFQTPQWVSSRLPSNLLFPFSSPQ